MSRRYVVLIAVVIAGALAVSAIARMPRGPRSGPAAVDSTPNIEVSLRLADGRLAPESAAVPKGSRVHLRLTNADERPAAVRLAGYEDRASIAALAPGSTWTAEFLADRPGDDFVWLVDDRPAGRLAVTGSHLIEGHR